MGVRFKCNRHVVLYALVGATFIWLAKSLLADAQPKKQARVFYEAEVQKTGMFGTQYSRILTDGVRFKERILRHGDEVERLFWGGKPAICWSYHPKSKDGGADPSAMYNAIFDEVTRDGEAAFRTRYNVRPDFHVPRSRTDIGPRVSLPMLSQLSVKQWHTGGHMKLAGYDCVEMSGVSTIPNVQYRIWLEPKHSVVLKIEESAPGIRTVTEARKIKFLRSLPDSAFQFPPGTRVRLLGAFKDAVLPKGVIREIYPAGPGSEFGIVLQAGGLGRRPSK